MNGNTNKDTTGGSKGLTAFAFFFVVISVSNMGIQISRRNNQGWFCSQHGFPLLQVHTVTCNTLCANALTLTACTDTTRSSPQPLLTGTVCAP